MAYCSGCFVQCASQIPPIEEIWERLASNGQIPKLEEKAEYHVYTFKKAFGEHVSVVYGYKHKAYLTIELVIEKDNTPGKPEAKVHSRLLEKKYKQKLEFYDKVVTTGCSIIKKAKEEFEKFRSNGGYSILTNNCQHFANAVLQSHGITNIPLTDGSIGTIGVLGIIWAMVVYVLSIFGGRGRKQHKD